QRVRRGVRLSRGGKSPPGSTARGGSCVGSGGQRMSVTLVASGGISLTGANLSYIIVAIVVAFVALGFAAVLVQNVLRAGRGTPKMQEIAGAVQEGASAYLTRQFKTLAIFVVIAVVLLYLLPVSDAGAHSETVIKIGR